MATIRKTERLLNLLIMLLVQRHYVAKQRIREILYADSSDEAFEKMFERDKDDLRSLGVPIEVGHLDAYFDDEPGYRIRPDRFALPDIQPQRRRGGRDRAGDQGLAARAVGRRHDDGDAQARGARCRRRRLCPRHRAAPAECRRAVVRRVLGGHPGADPRRLRLPAHRPGGPPGATCSPGAS